MTNGTPTPEPDYEPFGFPDILAAQGAAFGLGEAAGEADQGAPPATIQDLYEQRYSSDPEGAEQLLSGFYAWAMAQGLVADPNDPELSRAYLSEILGMDEGAAGGGAGGGGRTMFPEELELLRQQALTETYQRELLRQRAGTEAFNRARDKWDLLQATDQLADARRRAATEALIDALPYMVNPGQQYTPGFEPFGAGQELGNLLGANVPIQQLPTAELPLNELANPPLAAPGQDIAAGLEPFLGAPGTPQI